MSNTTTWIKAKKSGSNGGDCVEMAQLDEGIGVRDSKNPHGAVLRFTGAEFAAWVDGAKRGEFDFLLPTTRQ